jgi:hypothetical protein
MDSLPYTSTTIIPFCHPWCSLSYVAKDLGPGVYWGLNYKTFYSNCCIVISWSVCHFQSLPPYSNICGKARSPQLEWSPITGSNPLGFSLVHKYQRRVKVNGNGKHSSLLLYSNNYCFKSFIVKDPGSTLNTIINHTCLVRDDMVIKNVYGSLWTSVALQLTTSVRLG